MSQKLVENIRDFYVNAGFKVAPYSEVEVKTAEERLGGLPELLKSYLLTIGRIDGESQLPMDFSQLKDWLVEDDMLIFADDFAVSLADIEQEDPPVYSRGTYYQEHVEDYNGEWMEWGLVDDEGEMSQLIDFLVVVLKDNIDSRK
ncbi:hypothetical protein [Culicoidibacter larvae]|uniref:SMI1/KNR4 family protein n=1 Tax=Culicoidibacter larvae TaxID=2579976 RepID=A0A5R8QCD9_9FIRM|nr:hypothetical protein [Culicoidibacter larvae]TLG74172.1 hypothetical protein FEZ08_05545 [Culicoidibacter larvae]